MSEDELRHFLDGLLSEVSPPQTEGSDETHSGGPQPPKSVVEREELPSPERPTPQPELKEPPPPEGPAPQPELREPPPSEGPVPQPEREEPSTPQVTTEDRRRQTWRRHLIERLLRPLLVVGALAALGGSYVAYTSQDLWAIAVYVGACAVLGVITVWRRLPWNVRAAGLLLLVYAVGVTDLIRVGKGGESRLFLLVLPFLATLFLGRQGGAIALALVGLTMVGFGWAFSARHIAVPLERQASSADPFSWLTNTVVLLLLGSLMAVSLDYVLDYVVPRVARALARSRSLTRDVVEHRDRLLQRASALKRRALQLEISAEVGRTITSILDTDHLLQKTVEMTRDRLGCYLVALFLLDESGERADLAAAAGEAGVQVATKGLQLTVAETSLVGWTAKHRRPRLASNVRGDNLYRPDPLLPWTASEVTLPLIVGDQLLGVLDIQSRDSKAFEESDLDVLQGLADQVAVAIRNARMFHE